MKESIATFVFMVTLLMVLAVMEPYRVGTWWSDFQAGVNGEIQNE